MKLQLFTFYQFDRNVFRLLTVSTCLIVLSDFIFEFLQKKTKVDHLLDVLIFIFFLLFLFKSFSTSINRWRKNFQKFCNELNTVTKKFNLLFFLMTLYSSHCFSKYSKNIMMLCSSKCKVSENFEASINIMYRAVKNIMNENNTLEVWIKSKLLDDKSTW